MNKKEADNINNELSKYLDNSKDIENFCINNYKKIKESELYHSGGGIWIFLINMNNKIYSICDEILDYNDSDCIIYYGFKTINEFFNYQNDNYLDDLKKEFIKI